MGWLIFIIVVAAVIVIGYVVNHNLTVEELNDVKEDKKNLNEQLKKKETEIREVKRFPKPSDQSQLDAALSEITELKARLRQTEASEASAKQKIEYLQVLIDGQEFYRNQCDQLTKDKQKLADELKKVKESKPRPQMVYSDDQIKAQLNKKEEQIKSLKYDMSQIKLELARAYDDLEFVEEHNAELQNKIKELEVFGGYQDEYSKIIRNAVPAVASLPFAQIPEDFKESIESGRLNNAFNSHLMILDKFEISAKIKSDKRTYNTTLHTCDCHDRKYRGVVCKHMLFLSYTSGLLLLNKEVTTQINLQKTTDKS